MEDSPEDLPKPPRRTAARPFFTPRPNSGEGTTGPLDLGRRRSVQLFTPPGSSPATPVANRAAPPVADPARERTSELASSAADGSIEMTADAAASTNLSSDDRLHIEQYVHEEIELTATSRDAEDHAIEVIGYDDANRLLKATTIDGETPEVDGLRLESTEFSFEQAPPPPAMNVDSFWASEPFAKADLPYVEAAAPAAADEAEATIDEATAGAGESALESERFGTEPSIDEQPFEWADDPSTTISHAQAALEPEPEHDPEPRRASAPTVGDIAPPWMNRDTPASVQSLEELKESEPWDLTPSHSHEAVSAAPRGHDVADALERIAARVRDGELDVPAGADLSDEAALSSVLTALLRMRH